MQGGSFKTTTLRAVIKPEFCNIESKEFNKSIYITDKLNI